MQPCPTRRELAVAGLALLAGCKKPAGPAPASGSLAGLEAQHGGRLGVFMIDPATGHTLAQRADDRFLTCSAIKLLVVAAVLARADSGGERLDRRLPVTKADLVSHSPVTQARLSEGGLPVQVLCQAAIEV